MIALKPQALDAHSRRLIEQATALTVAVPPEQLTVEKRRAIMHETIPLYLPAAPPPAIATKDLTLALTGRSLPARLYLPEQASDVLCVFFHGGGWVVGDLATHHHACLFLAQHLGCKLLSVEYRKSPEHRFPAPCDDAADAYAWAVAQMPQWGCKRVMVCGDSAGGHLAAHVMCMHASDTAAALLFYPVTDMRFDSASYTQRGAGPGLTADGMRWFWQQFLGHDQATTDARAAVVYQQWPAPPAPTVLSLAWHDPLFDEGDAYARHLQNQGAEVQCLHAMDMAHGFLRQCWVNEAAQGQVLRAVAAVRQVLGLADAASRRKPG